MSHLIVDLSVLQVPNTNPLHPELPLDERRFRAVFNRGTFFHLFTTLPQAKAEALLAPMFDFLGHNGFQEAPVRDHLARGFFDPVALTVAANYYGADGKLARFYERGPVTADQQINISIYSLDYWLTLVDSGHPAEANWQPLLQEHLGIHVSGHVSLDRLEDILQPGIAVEALPGYDPVEGVTIVRPATEEPGFTADHFNLTL